jgi:hypothetical protein
MMLESEAVRMEGVLDGGFFWKDALWEDWLLRRSLTWI